METTTTQGAYQCDEVVLLNDFTLPEFVNGCHVCGIAAHLFDSPSCPYNIILGYNFLQAIGRKMDFQNNIIQWLDTIVKMKNIQLYNLVLHLNMILEED